MIRDRAKANVMADLAMVFMVSLDCLQGRCAKRGRIPSSGGTIFLDRCAVGVRRLLHQALLGQQARQRGPPITPVLPGIVRPTLRAGALGRGGVQAESL